jgi:hypothetical protein
MKRPPMWSLRPDLVSYVVDCYGGTEEVAGGRVRRVFLWEEGDEVLMGNTEAFTIHLGQKFGLNLGAGDAASIHSMLREMGERILPAIEGRRQLGKARGKWRQPDPEAKVIRRRTSASE